MRVYVGVGSNHDGKRNIRCGLQALRARYGRLQISPVYESEPVGCDGNNYYNLVVGIDSNEPYATILSGLQAIETSFVLRDEKSRALDLDLLLYGDQVIEDGDLRLPRPDVLKYAYVLKPLADIAGERLHPVAGRTYRELWQAFDTPGQRLWPVTLETDAIIYQE